MPGDSFTFAVTIGCQIEGIGLFEQALELGDLLFLIGVDHVVGLEAFFDVDRKLADGALFELIGQLRGLGKVANMPHGGFNDEGIAQVPTDGFHLRGGFHDQQ